MRKKYDILENDILKTDEKKISFDLMKIKKNFQALLNFFISSFYMN